jgi:hypothetical protein
MGKIIAVEGLATCNPVVRMEHSSACSKVSMFDAVNWMTNKGWWAAGLLLLAAAIFVGVFGGKLFQPVICVIGALTAFGLVFIASSIFNLIATVAGFWITIAVGIIFAVLAAVLLWKVVKLELFLLGLAGGAFMGTFFSSVVHSVTGFYAIWLYILLIIVFCLLGALLAAYRKEWLLQFGTALIGGYLFMRAMATFFGHYPDQAKMLK